MSKIMEAHLRMLSTLPRRTHEAKRHEGDAVPVGISKSVTVNGVRYPSILAAATATGHTQRTIVNMARKNETSRV